MRDYNYISPEGERIPVSQMTTADIEEVLRDGFEVTNDDGVDAPAEAIRERLVLELDIRRLGLRQ